MRFAFISFLVLAFCLPIRAWTVQGHQLIATLSWDYLTPQTKNWLAQQFNQAPLCVRQIWTTRADLETKFIKLSTWADLVGSFKRKNCQHYEQKFWHYRDFYWSNDGSFIEFRKKQEDILRGLEDIRATPEKNVVNIAWLIHLVADIHQPLHNASLVNRRFPRGDAGGNAIVLTPPCQHCPLSRRQNLHAYWDALLDDDDDIKGSGLFAIKQKARRLEAQYQDEIQKMSIKPLDFSAWSDESIELVKEFVYRPEIEPKNWPSLSYQQQAQNIARKSALLAAYRLANALNIFSQREDGSVR